MCIITGKSCVLLFVGRLGGRGLNTEKCDGRYKNSSGGSCIMGQHAAQDMPNNPETNHHPHHHPLHAPAPDVESPNALWPIQLVSTD
jgi:hypothetical protein